MTQPLRIPFNRPSLAGPEFEYIRQALEHGQLSGNGPFARSCEAWLERTTGCRKAILTPSCTAALEMCALLLDLQAGDEVIMPSFTFVSTATAFVLRGAVPVFVDVRADTLNLDEKLVEAAITPRTRAIVAVHYAGVACEMDELRAVADRHGVVLIEDAAQGLGATYRGRALGSLAALGAYSFHETKNVIAGEGGALLINDDRFVERAHIIRDKGTNRSQFYRGMVDKYTWVDLGSSYVVSEVVSAFLLAQLESAERFTARRLEIWRQYHEAFADVEGDGLVRRPIVPLHAVHNAHMYYLLLPDLASRTRVIDGLRESGILAVFHFVPLHSSSAGRRYGRAHGTLEVTDSVAGRLVRLPMFNTLTDAEVTEVTQSVRTITRGSVPV